MAAKKDHTYEKRKRDPVEVPFEANPVNEGV
jgi:hypothetical protein